MVKLNGFYTHHSYHESLFLDESLTLQHHDLFYHQNQLSCIPHESQGLEDLLTALSIAVQIAHRKHAAILVAFVPVGYSLANCWALWRLQKIMGYVPTQINDDIYIAIVKY